jgi:hypothetical protein
MPKILLTIEDLSQERNTISVFGESFEVMEPKDFGLEDQARLARIGKKFLSYESTLSEDLTEQEAKEAVEAIDSLVVAIMPGLKDRPDLVKKLKDNDKLAIVKAFIQAVKEKKVEPAPLNTKTKSQPSRLTLAG